MLLNSLRTFATSTRWVGNHSLVSGRMCSIIALAWLVAASLPLFFLHMGGRLGSSNKLHNVLPIVGFGRDVSEGTGS